MVPPPPARVKRESNVDELLRGSMGSSDRKTGTAGASNDGGSHVLHSSGSDVLGAPFPVATRDTAGITQYRELFCKNTRKRSTVRYTGVCAASAAIENKNKEKQKRRSSIALTRVNLNTHSTKHYPRRGTMHHPKTVRNPKPINPDVPQTNQKEEL